MSKTDSNNFEVVNHSIPRRDGRAKSAAPVLAHQDGGAPADPPRKEIGDAPSL